MTAVLVVAGAMLGAPLRYLVDRAVQARHDSLFPWGTFAVNVLGCIALGGLIGAGNAVPGTMMALAGTGLCGALTTYSTFSYETVRLLENRAYGLAVANVGTSLVAGMSAVIVGHAVASGLAG